MVRKHKDNGSRKFGAPLYCAAWPAGGYAIVGGGGGKRSSGIPNRAVVLKVENGSLADTEQGDMHMNELTPFNMALHPEGHTLVVGVGSAGLKVLDIIQQATEQPSLSFAPESEAQQEVLHSFGDAKGLTFSRDGKLLAVGVVDAVHIHEWPSLLHRASIRYAMHAVPAVPQLHSCQQAMGCIATQLILCCRKEKHALTDAVRDIDFSRGHANNAVHMQLASCACQPPQSHTAWHASSYLPMHILISYMINACLAQVIAVACEDGTCSLWLWAQAVCVDSLQLPPELSGGAFKACRFARNAQKGLFTVVNHQGSGHILYWQQNDLGEMTLMRQTKANSFAAPITAFDISARGNFLGTGTSEGDVATFSADDLRPLQRVKGAHMVFTTALVFSQDEQSLLTVSADASALATRVFKMPTSPSFQLYFILAVIACILAVVCAFTLSNGVMAKPSVVLSQQGGNL
ncbi:hypothetical protein ABBQ38_002318 [Trebouxia sp. C0009 RCD-2024]